MIIDELHAAPDDLDCARARERLSARLDGELAEEGALRAHLARCPDCRAHERALIAISRGFAALRESEPRELADLWPRIERRARPRPVVPVVVPVLARLAAALVGFVGLGGAAWLVERPDEARSVERHLLDRLARSGPGPEALFATLPEYRLLRALPAREESR
jgi:anti-sigma factor RsiW